MNKENERIIDRLKSSLSLGNDELSKQLEERLRAETAVRKRNGAPADDRTSTAAPTWVSIREEPAAPRVQWYSLTPEECGEGVVEWHSIIEQTTADETGPIPIQPSPSKPAVPRPAATTTKNDIVYINGILVEQPDIYRKWDKRHPGILTPTGFIYFLRNMNAWSFSTVAHVLLAIILMGALLIVKPQEDREIIAFTIGKPAGISQPLQEKGDKGDQHENPPAKKEEVKVVKDEIKDIKAEKPTETDIVKQQTEQPPVPDPIKTDTPIIDRPSPGPVAGGSPNSGGNASGATDPFAGRGGSGRGDALEKFGGNKVTEAAVEHGLHWLKRHQADSGLWSATRFTDRCAAGDLCADKRTTKWLVSSKYDSGLTGLALLCFLGAGYTHTKESVFRETVEKAVNALKSLQQPSGIIDYAERNMYNHAIVTLALAEAYAMTSDRELKRYVKKAVQYIEQTQQMGGGWDYHDDRNDRNDVSITGWCVMAMRAAAVGGIDVNPEVLEKVRALIERRTKETGEVVYAERDPNPGRKGNGMVAVGLVCRLYLGMKDQGPVTLGADRLLRHKPDWEALVKLDRREVSMISMTEMIDQNMYYWYYGTLAMFHLGGEYWQKWHASLRDMLVAKQRLVGCREGSWDPLPLNSWLSQEGGGRICSTAFNILNLEIYYRYVPMFAANVSFETPAPPADPIERLLRQIKMGKGASQGEKLEMLTALVRVSREGVNDRLLAAWQTFCEDGDTVVRWKAVIDLISLGKKEAIPLAQQVYAKESVPSMKGTILRELGKCYPSEESLVAFLLDKLNGTDEDILSGAVDGLKRLTGQPFATAEQWKEWSKSRKK